ncbi:MAG: hypothetical protein MUC60_19130, partial [Oscillatoria sp. Prado101]|nr:hypothetical protein [Oscillatoria sp. Prado101]
VSQPPQPETGFLRQTWHLSREIYSETRFLNPRSQKPGFVGVTRFLNPRSQKPGFSTPPTKIHLVT